MYSETVELADDGNGNLMLPLTDAALAECDWKEGDTIVWTDLGDGRFSLVKKQPEKTLVLVEAVRVTRYRYFVETPADHPEYALDTVTCNEATMWSKRELDEVIVSHRVITRDEFNLEDGVQFKNVGKS